MTQLNSQHIQPTRVTCVVQSDRNQTPEYQVFKLHSEKTNTDEQIMIIMVVLLMMMVAVLPSLSVDGVMISARDACYSVEIQSVSGRAPSQCNGGASTC